MNLRFLFACGLGILTFPQVRAAGWEPSGGLTQIPLWPGTVPDAQKDPRPEIAHVVTEELVAGKTWISVSPVTRPTLTVYPAKGKNTGAAVMIFPGGGYQILAMDLEGTEVCDWLTAKGVTCILVKYRVLGDDPPGQEHSHAYPFSPIALEDAQRAMGMVRLRAAEWHIDPHKLGVLGFSAGGHLVGAISTQYQTRLYPRIDDADDQSCRPDFAVAVYPGHMHESTKTEDELNPYVPVTAKTPPTLIVQAENDPVDDIGNSLVYFNALRKAGVSAELHIYAEGGHAFGLRKTEKPITDWPHLAEVWLRTIGVIQNE